MLRSAVWANWYEYNHDDNVPLSGALERKTHNIVTWENPTPCFEPCFTIRIIYSDL